jgi:flagellar hook-basal body complex protein FliE
MINPIAAINASVPIGSLNGTLGTSANTPGTGGVDFGKMLGSSLQKLQDVQNTSDNLAVAAATGDLTDVHDFVIAATEASLATQLTVAVRNKALDAFNEIMRLQA